MTWPEKHFQSGWVIKSSIGEYPYLTILSSKEPRTRVPLKDIKTSNNKRPIDLGVLVVVLVLNDLKWPCHVQGQKYQHAFSIHPWGRNFRLFYSTMSSFSAMGQFLEKCTKRPKSPWHMQVKKYQHACYIHCQGPNLPPFHSTMSHFWVTAQFMEKCTERPQMTLACSRSKISTCMLHPPLRPKLLSVLFYNEPFLSYALFFGKVHWMTPNDLDIFKVKKNPTYMLQTTPRSKFPSVSLYDFPVFDLRPNFRKSGPNDPKSAWHVQGKKYQHPCYIHLGRPNFQSVSLYDEPFLSCGLIFGNVNSLLV